MFMQALTCDILTFPKQGICGFLRDELSKND